MAILITGCGGMLGDAAYEILSKKHDVLATDIVTNEPWLECLDVRKWDDWLWYEQYDIETVYHLAAITDLEECEDNQDNAWATNAMGVDNAVRFCRRNDAELIYVSTAGIFDDPNQEAFTDYDFPSPKSIYGKSKYRGELIAQSYDNSYIFRAGWMMGGGVKDRKFVSKILEQINDGAKEIHAVHDKLGTPTYTYDFIHNAEQIVERGMYGTYNMVCHGMCSRYNVAVEIVGIIGLDIPVRPVYSDYFESEYWAPRPTSEQLINMKLDSLGLNSMRHWAVCLNEYLNNKR